MGRPIWREPTEKRTPDAALDPRRAAISRRSTTTRPRVRPSDRSSETLFNLLRSDYALESMNVGPARWNDTNVLTGPRSGTRRPFGRPESWRFRPEFSRSMAADVESEVYTPWFPPAGERERAVEQGREERDRDRERERERELHQTDEGESRHFRPPFVAAATAATAAVSTVTRRLIDEAGPRFRFPTRHRYLADAVDENDTARRTGVGSYATRDLHLPRFDIDGLGDRERSLRSLLPFSFSPSLTGLIEGMYNSPDATQWELVANDLGFQAACDFWESEESDEDADNLWDGMGEGEMERDRDEVDRLRRLTTLFAAQNRDRDMDRLVERL